MFGGFSVAGHHVWRLKVDGKLLAKWLETWNDTER